MDDRIALALTSHASRLFSPSFSRLHPLAQIFQKKRIKQNSFHSSSDSVFCLIL